MTWIELTLELKKEYGPQYYWIHEGHKDDDPYEDDIYFLAKNEDDDFELLEGYHWSIDYLSY